MLNARLDLLQEIIGTDAGDRGMKALIVPGDLTMACQVMASSLSSYSSSSSGKQQPVVKQCTLILSGFPCCVTHSPPTETDGPPGACAIARAALALGNDNNNNNNEVHIVTDDCNRAVFEAAAEPLLKDNKSNFSVQSFPSTLSPNDTERLKNLANKCTLLIACERAGPAKDGHCYTMRAIDMTALGLIAPLERLVEMTRSTVGDNKKVPFIAIGDGGNELGMGKVLDKIVNNNPKIANGDTIACVVSADYLIAASVSNWGGYALAAGAALVRATTTTQYQQQQDNANETTTKQQLDVAVTEWMERYLPSEQDEIDLLHRCVAAGCRDGVSGKLEATVDGMPLETSLQCLRDIVACCADFES